MTSRPVLNEMACKRKTSPPPLMLSATKYKLPTARSITGVPRMPIHGKYVVVVAFVLIGDGNSEVILPQDRTVAGIDSIDTVAFGRNVDYVVHSLALDGLPGHDERLGIDPPSRVTVCSSPKVCGVTLATVNWVSAENHPVRKLSA